VKHVCFSRGTYLASFKTSCSLNIRRDEVIRKAEKSRP
jgi:hypothetical protein